MSGERSRAKGARGENECIKHAAEHGFEGDRRMWSQYCGVKCEWDVELTKGDLRLLVQVKRHGKGVVKLIGMAAKSLLKAEAVPIKMWWIRCDDGNPIIVLREDVLYGLLDELVALRHKFLGGPVCGVGGNVANPVVGNQGGNQ